MYKLKQEGSSMFNAKRTNFFKCYCMVFTHTPPTVYHKIFDLSSAMPVLDYLQARLRKFEYSEDFLTILIKTIIDLSF